ncbi:metallophosphoesterase [Mesobacterium sp. TK19101]|uniref:Metallophosphoesterase n=1 Tax=Mesobacterium hydrothermale TaxID=3111907 RepID=A0ABU6HJJ4_9RHOB|nr:metallophosphoesterase [Mesobacterium sp. TK19101]MEC3862511.1 metallophosphoesterase [Mesobacterium sp. TK19101]
MRKILFLTDLHMTDAGQTIIGLDPAERLARVLDHALAHHGDAAHVLILGDLAHHGRPAEYERLAAVMARCPLPITATLGNHDNRANARAALPWLARDDAGFAQASFGWGDTRVIVLDTLDEDGIAPHHGGYLCGTRMNWLRQQLHETLEPNLLVALHHPPLVTGFDGMDAIHLSNAPELVSILSRQGRPAHLICGHVHRTVSGRTGVLSYTLLKSPCHQMPMKLGPGSSGLSVDEPGAYGIVLLHDSGPIVHTEDVFDAPSSVAEDPKSA